MRVTCQRCGKQTFRKQIGYNNIDAATMNRHSMFDQFEPMLEGWLIKHDLGGWLCPECVRKYNQLVENFKLSR